MAARTLQLPPESIRALDYLRETLAETLEDCEAECGPVASCDRPSVERRLLDFGLVCETRFAVARLRASIPLCPN
jgi:hypothetical protein